MTDLVGAMRAELDRLEKLARDATPGPWSGYADEKTGKVQVFAGPVEYGYLTGEVLDFQDHTDCEECHRLSAADLLIITRVASPDVVLRRIEADRARIERHRPTVEWHVRGGGSVAFCVHCSDEERLLDAAEYGEDIEIGADDVVPWPCDDARDTARALLGDDLTPWGVAG